MSDTFSIRFATKKDVELIHTFITKLATHLQLTHEIQATSKLLQQQLFGKNPRAEVILGYFAHEPVAFALFFHNFSTPLAQPGLYLEDLYVKPEMRGRGFGKKMLAFLAGLAIKRKCVRFEWMALRKDKAAMRFYKKIGAKSMDAWVVFRSSGKSLQSLAKKSKHST